MAGAKTPTTLWSDTIGSLKLFTATFADIDDSDTYASGAPGIVGAWVNASDDPGTQTSGGIDVSYSGTTFTFRCGEDNRVAKLYFLTTV